MSRVVIDLDRLIEFVARLGAFQAQLDHTRDEVDAALRTAHATWSGTAASAQDTAHAHWCAGAADARNALAVLRSIVATSHANYASAVHTNQIMWRS
jgi:hypothetical protein